MYSLYGTLQTGTCAVQAALAEAQAPYEMIEVSTSKGDHLSEDYRQINPRQQVPALRLPDGSVMTEGAAILLHIGDAHPASRLVPPPGSSARAQHDRWLIYFAVNVYEGELRKLFAARYTDDPQGAPGIQRAAHAYVDRHYVIFEQALSKAPYIFGDHLTVLDIYLWMLAQWIDGEWLARECPRIAKLADTVKKRPLIAPIQRANFG